MVMTIVSNMATHNQRKEISSGRFLMVLNRIVSKDKVLLINELLVHSHKSNQTMKSSHNQTTIPHHQVEYPRPFRDVEKQEDNVVLHSDDF